MVMFLWSTKTIEVEHLILNFTRKSPFIYRKQYIYNMKKPFYHGYPWSFIDIQNSILDVLFNYGIHNFGIHNLVIEIYP